ncbi:MAG: arginase family protein [Candidatus Aminicenantes bacterium]|nr:arginase family protein [Candidatus Aminicenantes bacterium]
MKKKTILCPGVMLIVLVLSPVVRANQKDLSIAVVRNDSEGPRIMAESGLPQLLEQQGCTLKGIQVIQLTPSEEKEYGEWNRDALESRHIGRLVAQNRLNENLIIGLLTNCTDVLGMLAGLQHLGPATVPGEKDFRSLQRDGLAGLKPLRVGLVYIDAHADFNTPETSLSGMLGGMPVAIATGLCLTRLRLKTGLDPALPSRYVVFGGLRDVDPFEQDLLDRSDCTYLSVDDFRTLSNRIDEEMVRLSRLTDIIYVHIDMDVLDPGEVSGHPLTAPEGPTSAELAAALERMFSHSKTGALGIASMPFGERDKDGLSLRAAYRLIEGAVKGVLSRQDPPL